MELMPGFKKTEVGVIPEEWDVATCADVSNLITVGIVIRPTQYYEKQGVPAFRSANIREDGIDDSDLVFISERANSLLRKSQVQAGDVLTVRTGYPGTSAVVPSMFAGANCIDILITRPSDSMNSDFLAAWINSPFGKQQVLRNQGGLAQQHFNVGDLRELVVALPSTAEQGAIAAALSDVDALIASLNRLIAKKRDMKQAAMQELLTGKRRLPGFSEKWEVKQLGEIGVTYGGLTGKTKTDFGTGTARYIPFLNVIGNVVIDTLNLECVRVSASENQHQTMKGDLFFNGSSETPEEVGMCSVLRAQIPRVYLNSFCFGFRLREGVEADGLFLAYFFRSGEGRALLYSSAQGATRYNLSKVNFLKLEIPFPTLNEQTAIVGVLSDMDAEITALEQKRNKTQMLKQGMIQELLTGRIRLV